MTARKLNEIFKKGVLPFFIVAVTLFSLSSFYNLTLKLDDLVRIDGQVYTISIKEESGIRGRTNHNLYICLSNGAKFKIMDDKLFEPARNAIKKTVQPGDDITIYRRTQQQTNFGLGTKNLIYQLEYRGEILMPLSLMKTNFRVLLIFELLILFGLIAAQIFKMRK